MRWTIRLTGAFFTGSNNPGNRIEVTNGVVNLHGPLGNYGNSDQDIRSSFSFSTLWYIPVGRGQRFLRTLNPVANSIVSGWQINAFTIWFLAKQDNGCRRYHHRQR